MKIEEYQRSGIPREVIDVLNEAAVVYVLSKLSNPHPTMLSLEPPMDYCGDLSLACFLAEASEELLVSTFPDPGPWHEPNWERGIDGWYGCWSLYLRDLSGELGDFQFRALEPALAAVGFALRAAEIGGAELSDDVFRARQITEPE